MQAIMALLFAHSIVDSSNVSPVFLDRKELDIAPLDVCNYDLWFFWTSKQPFAIHFFLESWNVYPMVIPEIFAKT